MFFEDCFIWKGLPFEEAKYESSISAISPPDNWFKIEWSCPNVSFFCVFPNFENGFLGLISNFIVIIVMWIVLKIYDGVVSKLKKRKKKKRKKKKEKKKKEKKKKEKKKKKEIKIIWKNN